MSSQNPISKTAGQNPEPFDIVTVIIAKDLSRREGCYTAISDLFEIASRDDKNSDWFIDAVPVIMGALKDRLGDYELCRMGLATLDKIIGESHLWRSAAEAGGLSFYVNILKKYKRDIVLCRWACIGLGAMLAVPHPDLVTPNYHDVDRVCDIDGIEALVDTMNKYFNNEDICIGSCKALSLIVRLSDQYSNICVKEGLIPVLFDILEFKSGGLVLTACDILLDISKYGLLHQNDCREAIPLLVKAVENGYNPEICISVCIVLVAIVDTNAEYVKVALESGACDIFTRAQNIHIERNDVVSSAGQALHCIAKKDFLPHDHALSLVAHDGVCDICGSCSWEFMGCRACDYDECMLCTVSGTEWKTLI